ncbi:MAG: hypothetical protein WCV63_06285 [Negativicutes bacterium]|jgi:type II secretory pathway pseudopilin PulG
MLMQIRLLLANRKGTFLVEALIAAVVVGIAVVALLAAFGRSSDIGDASAEYIMANCLAQKQLELLKDNITDHDGTIYNKAFWDGILPTYQTVPPDIPNTPVIPTNPYYAMITLAPQGDISPLTLKGSNSQFTIVNKVYWAYDAINPATGLRRGNGNINILCTVSWTSDGRTGTSKPRNVKIITQIKYPLT